MSRILDDRAQAPGLDWWRRRVDDVDVIFLTGELDLVTAPALRSRLMSAAETSTAAVLVLDLSQVGFLDAQSAGIIAAARQAAACHGRRLRVEGLHGMPKLVFDLLGLREESG